MNDRDVLSKIITKIKALEDVISGGGGGGGESNVMIVNITYDDDNSIFLTDKSSSEISQAVASGKMVFAVFTVPDDESVAFPLARCSQDPETQYVYFSSITVYPDTGVGEDGFEISGTTVTRVSGQYPTL